MKNIFVTLVLLVLPLTNAMAFECDQAETLLVVSAKSSLEKVDVLANLIQDYGVEVRRETRNPERVSGNMFVVSTLSLSSEFIEAIEADASFIMECNRPLIF